ncbi:ankyrin repeat domain-containing protein [Flavobacterium sp.]|uniref:ankyrin repeat domain-containing protein n=1 Tax=Flavobacterium sp. TaxID=239 RepID=UPI00121E5DAE|nr:ankyrin repeat domain-containing protein [Flavobacterium sp.]RZJ70295.1 MAG: ankyrin repeat domain-containing protein [Flavobacterium sp.]
MAKMTLDKARSVLKKHKVEANGKHLFDAFGNPELFEALLVAGADSNHFDTEFNVPILSLAYSRQEYPEFALLLQHGANPDVPSSTDVARTPILFEIVSSDPDGYLSLMIQANADLNQFHPETGNTLIMHAATHYYVSLEMLEVLIKNGADSNLPNRDGFTIYDLIDQGKVSFHKPNLLFLKKHQTGYSERIVTKEIVPPAQTPDLRTQFSHSIGSFRGIKVIGKTDDTLTVRMYRTKRYDSDFPRTHTDGLNIIFSLLEHSETLSDWKDVASTFDFQKNHVSVARKFIASTIVSDFDLTFHEALWLEKGYCDFDEISDETREMLQQATMAITVTDPTMLETISVGTSIKISQYNVAPIWYLENKASSSYFVLFTSDGGKCMSKQGEIGQDAKAKPVAGISKGYYKEENLRAEAHAFSKFGEGFELVYKNFDTAYNLEEGIEEAARQAKINESKADYSEDALEAIQSTNVAKLKSILETGVHPDTLKDKYGNLALGQVAGAYFPESAHLEMLKSLLEKGANPNHEAYQDEPLLQKVSRRAKNELADEMVRTLLDAGADISSNASELYQKTSTLQSACRGGMLWFADYLIEKGANLHYKDENGLAALNYAVQAEKNGVEIIDLLLKNGADKNDLNTFSYKSNVFQYAGSIAVIEKLVALGFDIDKVGDQYVSAIYTAAERGSIETFEAYLRLGAQFERYRILGKITDNFHRNDKDFIARQIEKLRIIHKLGHSIVPSSDSTALEKLHDQFRKRKKIAKWEENALLDLWEMDCKPQRLRDLAEFNDYVTKVNSQPLMQKCAQRLSEIQAALN